MNIEILVLLPCETYKIIEKMKKVKIYGYILLLKYQTQNIM